MLAKFSAKALSIALFTKQAVGQLTNLRLHQDGRDLQDGSFSFPTSIVPNDEIINGAADADAYKVVLEDTDEPILQQEEKPLDDGILHSKDAAKAAGTLVDLIAALKNGKNIDAVSSAVKEVVAKGFDGEDIKAVLNEVLTILVDLTWNEKKSENLESEIITSSTADIDWTVSAKSSKKSAKGPFTTTQATEGPFTCDRIDSIPQGGCCETDAQCVYSGSGDGSLFCNENNQCECRVAPGGNGNLECCTEPYAGPGQGGCAPNCKSMHFHASIASPFQNV